jgi:hypothetical protein
MGCGCGCGTTPCSGPATFSVLDGQALGNTLLFKAIPLADKLRDLRTRLGERPYRVRILRTRWSQGQRGRGQEMVVWEQMLLPTPLISDLTGVATVVNPVGLDEIGSIMLSQISGEYTEDNLMGKGTDGSLPDLSEQVFYEIEFPRLDGKPGERRRFTPHSAPSYKPTKFQWTINLERAHMARDRAGDPR